MSQTERGITGILSVCLKTRYMRATAAHLLTMAKRNYYLVHYQGTFSGRAKCAS